MGSVLDDDEKLDGKSKEEEEVELQESDVDLDMSVSTWINTATTTEPKYLVGEIAPFHAQIGGDVLVDGPGKLVV